MNEMFVLVAMFAAYYYFVIVYAGLIDRIARYFHSRNGAGRDL